MGNAEQSMRRVHVLIETISEKAFEVAVSLRCKPHVRTADVVVGTYDIIAMVEGPDVNAVAKVTFCDIPDIEGVKRVSTYPVTNQQMLQDMQRNAEGSDSKDK